ncbi:MAG TPA: alpha/beta family hydrolase [Acidimicrobiia bacterium]
MIGGSAEALELRVEDDVVLEAELAMPEGELRAAVVLCHPHPLYGGSMRSIVISELFRVLPARGVVCLRFNFRGVERSTGAHDEGRGERADARAAIDALVQAVPTETPVVLAGWSFGGDVALSVHDERLGAWLVVAPPLRFAETGPLADDPRPKHFVLAEHDEYRAPAEVAVAVESWRATTLEVVAGASHFFVGRTDAVVAAADRLIDRVAR